MLGLTTTLYQKVVTRQVFAHSHYSIIDGKNKSNPDYWTSILWKRLIGNNVFTPRNGLNYGHKL